MSQSKTTRTLSAALALALCTSSALAQRAPTPAPAPAPPPAPSPAPAFTAMDAADEELPTLEAPEGANTPAKPTPPEDKAPSVNPKHTARVSIEVVRGDGVVVGIQDTHTYATNGEVSAIGGIWKDICTAPCAFSTAPGVRTIVLQSEKHTTTYRLHLKPGHTVVRYKDSNPKLRTAGVALLIAGGVLATVGFALMLPSERTYTPGSFQGNTYQEGRVERGDTSAWATPLLISGGVALGAGGIMLGVGYMTSVDHKVMPKAEPSQQTPMLQARMLTARGTFLRDTLLEKPLKKRHVCARPTTQSHGPRTLRYRLERQRPTSTAL